MAFTNPAVCVKDRQHQKHKHYQLQTTPPEHAYSHTTLGQLGRQEGVFDNILEVASKWCLSGPLKRLAYSRINFSLLQRQSTSQEKHRSLTHNHQAFSSISLLDRRDLCLCHLQLHVHYYSRHSTIDLSLLYLKRASETQNHLTFSYWVPEHQGTGDFMRSECMKLNCLCLCHSH